MQAFGYSLRQIKLPEHFFMGFALLLAVYSFYVCWSSIDTPLLDEHSFRQTQTALTIYWLSKGGAWFAYETPVMGAPWSIPFEFPTYQLLAALLVQTGLSIEAAGRTVSYGFLLALIWPVRVIAFELKWPPVTSWIFMALLLASPMYTFWARTVMIETTAVFLGTAWLAYLLRFYRTGTAIDLTISVVAGCLCALTKATTFPAFGFAGACFIICKEWPRLRQLSQLLRQKRLWGIGFLGVYPILIAALWTQFTDQIKSQSEVGALLTSSHLSSWNYGSWSQRWSPDSLWTFLTRMLPDTFGIWGTLTAIALFVYAFRVGGRSREIAIALCSFFVGLLIFTNLHIVHNYYQIATAIFLIAATALAITLLIERRGIWKGAIVFAIFLTSQIHYFNFRFVPKILADHSQSVQLRIATLARKHTTDNQSLLIFGDDWSSAIPFYAQRKSLAVPNWVEGSLLRRILADPQKYLGDRKLGAIVLCPALGEIKPELFDFVRGRNLIADANGCLLVSPDISSHFRGQI